MIEQENLSEIQGCFSDMGVGKSGRASVQVSVPTVLIYGLKEPGTNHVRYIGKTSDLKQRMYQHYWNAERPKTHRDCWIKGLIMRGLEPETEILNEVPESEWQTWEKAHIELYKLMGHELTNATDGGDGVTMTPEIRAKIGDKKRGTFHSDEAKQKMSLSHTGKKLIFSEQHCERISAGKKGVQTTEFTPEVRAKLRAGQQARRAKEKLAKEM